MLLTQELEELAARVYDFVSCRVPDTLLNRKSWIEQIGHVYTNVNATVDGVVLHTVFRNNHFVDIEEFIGYFSSKTMKNVHLEVHT